jgi:hypothetical protein
MAMDGGFNNNGDDDLKRRFDAACAPLERSVGNGLTPGGVLGIVDLRHGRITAATGSAAIMPERRPMTLRDLVRSRVGLQGPVHDAAHPCPSRGRPHRP